MKDKKLHYSNGAPIPAVPVSVCAQFSVFLTRITNLCLDCDGKPTISVVAPVKFVCKKGETWTAVFTAMSDGYIVRFEVRQTPLEFYSPGGANDMLEKLSLQTSVSDGEILPEEVRRLCRDLEKA